LTLKCLRASVALGNGMGMVQLGEMYLGGRVPLENGQDKVQEAIKWWNLAWEHGAPRGYHNLGLLYYDMAVPGTGGAGVGLVKQDYEKAFQYFKAAADKGDTKAVRYTGLCYENGYGVKQDYAQAAKYFQIIGGYYYANYLLEGKGGIVQDVKRALAIYQSVMDRDGGGQEDQYSAYALGQIYEKGTYVKADQDKAIEYYQIAAAKGSAAAKTAVVNYASGLYKQGYALLTAGKNESGLPLLYKAATLGNADALKVFGK
jgi:TPR repeat protein